MILKWKSIYSTLGLPQIQGSWHLRFHVECRPIGSLHLGLLELETLDPRGLPLVQISGSFSVPVKSCWPRSQRQDRQKYREFGDPSVWQWHRTGERLSPLPTTAVSLQAEVPSEGLARDHCKVSLSKGSKEEEVQVARAGQRHGNDTAVILGSGRSFVSETTGVLSVILDDL